MHPAGSVVVAVPAVVQLNQAYAVVGTGCPFHVPLVADSSVDALGVPLMAGAVVTEGKPTTKLDDVRDTI